MPQEACFKRPDPDEDLEALNAICAAHGCTWDMKFNLIPSTVLIMVEKYDQDSERFEYVSWRCVPGAARDSREF